MTHRSICLFVCIGISVDAFERKDQSMNHFDAFDDIINHIKLFRQELNDFEHSIADQTSIENSKKPDIKLIDEAKTLSIIIDNVDIVADKEKDIEATIIYNTQNKPDAIKIAADQYTIEVDYDRQNRYVDAYIVYQSSSKHKEKDSKGMQSVHYSIRKGQRILSQLDIEEVTVEADHNKKSIKITIPKTEEKTVHKKINVKTINTK